MSNEANEQDAIAGLKLIRNTTEGVDNPDDPSYPYKLRATFRAPELMMCIFLAIAIARTGRSENETIVVRGMTREAIEEFVSRKNLNEHPRLLSLSITGPDEREESNQ